MSALKKFFEKGKAKLKFKLMGEGHSLDGKSNMKPRQLPPEDDKYVSQPSTSRTNSSKMAGQAALDRLEKTTYNSSGPLGLSKTSIRLETKRLMELEKREQQRKDGASSTPSVQEIEKDFSSVLDGVFFRCPLVGPDIVPYKEMLMKIDEFLTHQLTNSEDGPMAAALMIQTMNKDPETVKICIETLCKYLNNILSQPDDPKFRKIRFENRVFSQRVEPVRGGKEFLMAAGFTETLVPGDNDKNEKFLVIDDDKCKDTDKFAELVQCLLVAEPIRPELDRNIKVFIASHESAAKRFDPHLPSEFFNITTEELKREQELRAEAVEKMGMLRTKAMRERDEQRALRRYRYTLLRVRFPNNLILQATFRATETLQDVAEFIRECLVSDWIPFKVLDGATGKVLFNTTDEKESKETLAECTMVPAAVLTFHWDPKMIEEILASNDDFDVNSFLKKQFLALAQPL